MIGDVLEIAIETILRDFAAEYSLYLDKRGPRPARKGNKVSWTDSHGNKHDLDFVLERGGTEYEQGTPVAFIEAAWRRYTKHSRNKAQEIQGAIIPLFEKHRRYHPFIGAILAGVFTADARNQLKSLGFSVAYFPYDTVLSAFGTVNIDASSDESTPDNDFVEKFQQWDALCPSDKAKVGNELVKLNACEVNAFIEALRRVTMRTVKSVRILPLHGSIVEWANVVDAISFIRGYKEDGAATALARYEVQVVYINGDKISGEFAAKNAAIEFLKSYITELGDAVDAAK